MSRTKRPWGVVAGPIIFFAGIAFFWGGKAAVDVRDRVEDWSHQLRHSHEPVVMDMPSVPLIPPLYVDGERVGRIETVVVGRDRPGAIDSVRVVASVSAEHIRQLVDCALRLRLSSIDGRGYTQALNCADETAGLEPFGSLVVEGSNLVVPIVVSAEDLPCGGDVMHTDSCGGMSRDLQRELRRIQQDLRREAQKIRVTVGR